VQNNFRVYRWYSGFSRERDATFLDSHANLVKNWKEPTRPLAIRVENIHCDYLQYMFPDETIHFSVPPPVLLAPIPS